MLATFQMKFWLLASLILNFVFILLYLDDSIVTNLLTSYTTNYIPPSKYTTHVGIDFDNATVIFNIVQGALKQKDSNLNPVGVGFFPAYIPPNTLFYHSTPYMSVPDSCEWIAFNYEFSYAFSGIMSGGHPKRRPGRGPNRGGIPSNPPGDLHPPSTNDQQLELDEQISIFNRPTSSQDYLPNNDKYGPGHGPGHDPGNPKKPRGGPYIYTFRNKKPLTKLIYLDGASAAKTNTGEMDQQLILSRQKDISKRVNEYEAAKKICAWGKSFGLEGIIRLEIGYEMILCDFHDDIELVSNVTLSSFESVLNFPQSEENSHVSPLSNDAWLELQRDHFMIETYSMANFEHLRLGGMSNDGETRVFVDYSKLVTPVGKTWINPDPYLRRIHNISDNLKEEIISQLEQNLIEGACPFEKTNWQIITEVIVDKFSPILLQLNNTLSFFEYQLYQPNTKIDHLLNVTAHNVSLVTYNFVRRYNSKHTTGNEKDFILNRSQIFQFSVLDYVHHNYDITTESEVLIYSSIYKVYTYIFNALLDSFEISKAILYDLMVEPTEINFNSHERKILALKDQINNLINGLRWSAFTKCKSVCGWDEACYIPTWGPGPFGWGNDIPQPGLEYDGKRYRISKDLYCINYKDFIR